MNDKILGYILLAVGAYVAWKMYASSAAAKAKAAQSDRDAQIAKAAGQGAVWLIDQIV